MEVIKEKIQTQKLLKEDKSIIVLKEEYLIPDTHQDVENVLMIDTKPFIISKEVVKDKMIDRKSVG